MRRLFVYVESGKNSGRSGGSASKVATVLLRRVSTLRTFSAVCVPLPLSGSMAALVFCGTL